MKAKPFVCAAFLLLFALAALTRLTAAEIKRPNIVIYLADDAGWGDYSHSGNTQVRTPNIDSIARDGASLDRFLFARCVRQRERSFSRAVIIRAAECAAFLYTVRAPASRFRPPVFGAGPYRIKVGANRPDGLDFGPSDPAPPRESRVIHIQPLISKP